MPVVLPLLHLLPLQLTAAVPAVFSSEGHPSRSRCGDSTRTDPQDPSKTQASYRRLAEAPTLTDSTPPDEATSAAPVAPPATLGTDDVLGAQPSTPAAAVPTTEALAGPEVQGVYTKPSAYQSLNPECAHSEGPALQGMLLVRGDLSVCTSSSMHMQQTEWMVCWSVQHVWSTDSPEWWYARAACLLKGLPICSC